MKFESPEMTKTLACVEKGLTLMRENDVFPIVYDGKETTEESLRSEIETLQNKTYTIAVCGVVKAGKSTVINSLIFADTVLPTFDTPLTAKLTFIEYTEEPNPYFEVSFYDRKEWEEILEGFGEAERQALEARVELCAERGARLNAYVLPERHETVRVDDLGKLEEYVTDPNNGKGIYTPFVKSVTVRLHNESIKAIRIVDTPGLNDANVINSSETANWVAKAHAVIYVLDVRGAAVADVEFFQKYFPSTAVEARIFVQNQIDTAYEDYKAAKAAIRRYGAEQKYKDMGLFGPNETICSYSALGMLLKAKAERGDDLTEEEQEYWNDFQEMGISDFDPDHLAETLAKKLYAREGHVRIDRIRGILPSACKKAVASCEDARGKADNKVKDAKRNVEECEAQRKAYQDFQDQLDQKRETQRKNFENLVSSEYLSNIEPSINRQLGEIRKKMSSVADTCEGNPDLLMRRVPRVLMELVHEDLVPQIKSLVTKAIAKIRNNLDNIPKELDKVADNVGISDKIRLPRLNLALNDILTPLLESELVNPSVIYEKVPGRFAQFFSFFTNKNAKIANATACEIAVKALDEKMVNLREKLERDFTQCFDDALGEIYSQYETYADDRQAGLKAAMENHDALQRNLSQLEAEAKALATREETLKASQRELEYLLEGKK